MRNIYGQYDYRFIAGMMRNACLGQGDYLQGRSYLVATRLKNPTKASPKGKRWFNDGSCMRLRANHPNHVWSYDFVFIRDDYGGKIHMLTTIDKFIRK